MWINLGRNQMHFDHRCLPRANEAVRWIHVHPASLIVFVKGVLRSIARGHWPVRREESKQTFKVEWSIHVNDAADQFVLSQ